MPKTERGQGMKESTKMAMRIIRKHMIATGEPITFSEMNQLVQEAGLSYQDAYNALQNFKNYEEIQRVGGTHKNNVIYQLTKQLA